MMIDVSKLFTKTQEAFDKKNYEYAIDLTQHILEIQPKHPKARRILRISTIRNYEIKSGIPSGVGVILSSFIPMVKIVVLSLLGKKTLTVLNTCESYLAKNPASIWGRHKLANVLQHMGYTDSAIQEHEGILSLAPEHIPSLKALGELHQTNQDIQKAIDYYKKVFALDPTDFDTPRALKDLAAITTIKRGGWSGAQSSRDVIRDKGKMVELEKSSQLTKARDIDAEIKRLEAIVQENPNNPQNIVTLKKIGELCIQKKDYPKAQTVYQQAVKLNPSDGMISMRLGDIKLLIFDQELSRLQKELIANPSDQTMNSKVGALKSERRNFRIEEYRRRVQVHPTDMNLHFQLATALYSAGQIDEAIAEFQTAARDPKRRVSSYKYLGEAFSRKKHYDLAITQFKKALETGALSTEQSKELSYFLSKAYEDNKNHKEAIEEYKKILEIDFNYKDTAKRVEKLKELAQNNN